MKYLYNYTIFKINEDWLSDRLRNSSDAIKNSLSIFSKEFNLINKKVKGEWQEEFKVDDIKSDFINIITKSFNNLIKSIDKMDNIDDVQTIYDEITQYLVQLNDNISKGIDKLTKESKRIKTYNAYLKLNEAQESTISALKVTINKLLQSTSDLLDSNRETFLKIFEQDPKAKEEKGLDSIREEVKKLFQKISKNIQNGTKDIDLKSIVDSAKAKVETNNSTSTNEYTPGTILKYQKKDGGENIAEVANNQENVEDGYINLISQDGKETFIIKVDSIIGVANEDGDVEVTPEDITNSLEDIKGDKKAMNKLKNYIENELQ